MQKKLREEPQKWSMDELNRLSVEEYKEANKLPVVLVLDNVRSMHNVGSVFRTSDAFRVEKLCLCGITATPPHREISKTALGATESVVWQHYPHTIDCVQQLKAEGYRIMAIEQVKGSQKLDATAFPNHPKTAFIFGNEVFGIHEEVLKHCDAFIEIPQFGTKHSFNISISVGIVLWHYFISGKEK
ncbi:MAG TPA: RNA methyltransferase [Cytophagales bacterium]|jgi:tRNA G18 (ribose-2'-O)-methylase SpoU|nr:RNA methyltransferase [Cytophagales bacterium]